MSPHGSFRAALWSTPYGWVKPGLGVSPNSGPPVGGLALMSPQGFFGDPTSALLPATAQRAHGASAIRGGFANGNWFFGRKGKLGLSPEERARIDKEYKGGKRTTSPPQSNGLRERRQRLARQRRAATRNMRKFGASRQMSANEVRGRSPIGANEVRGRSPIGLRSSGFLVKND